MGYKAGSPPRSITCLLIAFWSVLVGEQKELRSGRGLIKLIESALCLLRILINAGSLREGCQSPNMQEN
jgi:hypothetical protein